MSARSVLNGGRDESAAMLVDGVSPTTGDWGFLSAVPGTDSIVEVQVVRNSYDAQYGRTAGGNGRRRRDQRDAQLGPHIDVIERCPPAQEFVVPMPDRDVDALSGERVGVAGTDALLGERVVDGRPCS